MENERVIFDNYDLDANYKDEALETLEINGNENPSDDDIWNMMTDLMQENEAAVFDDLEDFFSGNTFIASGTIGRWDGDHSGFMIFSSFEELLRTVLNDCELFRFTDVDGHLYMKASHHDGTNYVEIKAITKKGKEFYDDWCYGENSLNEKEMHNELFTNNEYSMLPNYL